MAVGEAARLRLFDAARRELGDDEADTLMDLLPPHDWSGLATTDNLASLRSEVSGEIASLRAEMTALEGRLNLAMATQTRTLVFSMLASNVTLVGLAFAAARLGG
jgi:hypothetical protein